MRLRRSRSFRCTVCGEVLKYSWLFDGHRDDHKRLGYPPAKFEEIRR